MLPWKTTRQPSKRPPTDLKNSTKRPLSLRNSHQTAPLLLPTLAGKTQSHFPPPPAAAGDRHWWSVATPHLSFLQQVKSPFVDEVHTQTPPQAATKPPLYPPLPPSFSLKNPSERLPNPMHPLNRWPPNGLRQRHYWSRLFKSYWESRFERKSLKNTKEQQLSSEYESLYDSWSQTMIHGVLS